MSISVLDFQKMKLQGEKISMVTAYDYTCATLVDQAEITAILVGDSLGNVMLGYPNTISVTMEDMIHHCKAVTRAVTNSFVVVDMPFLSYQTSVYDAVCNAGRLMKEGNANAVKLEGGIEVKEQIKAITTASIPVMAHLGVTPQSIHVMGGYKVQGKTKESIDYLVESAYAVQQAGAFAVVLECVTQEVAAKITSLLHIPTIGIGAGAGVDGQILVLQDLLGMSEGHVPKFVKCFGTIGNQMKAAFESYKMEVETGQYPGKENSYQAGNEIKQYIEKVGIENESC